MSTPNSSLPVAIVQKQAITFPSGISTVLAQFLEPVQDDDAIVIALCWEGTTTINGITDSVNDSFSQIVTTSYGSGASKVNVAIWECLASAGGTPLISIAFSGAPTSPSGAIIDANGSTNPVSQDATATGSALFNGSPTTQPSVAVTLTSYFESLVAIVFAPSASSMTALSGWNDILSSGPAGVFWNSLPATNGAFTAKPCTLNASVASAIAVVGLASLTSAVLGEIFAPLFPDTFAPRLADQLYDSLQGDPTFVANPYGPQPFLNT